MSKIIQSSYVELMNCIYNNITKRIPVRVREIIILVVFIILALYFIVFRSATFYQKLLNEQDICQFFGGFLLMIVAILSMRKELTTVQWRPSLIVPYMLFALGLVVIGLMHPIGGGYGFFGLMLLSVYPCLYLTWNNRGDYEELFDKIAVAFMVTGTAYFLWFSYLDLNNLEPIRYDRHLGTMYNSNFLTFLGASIGCASLYYLYRCLTKGKKNYIVICYCLISIAIGATLTIKGAGRSAMFIVFVNALVVVFFLVKRAIISSEDKRAIRRKSVIVGMLAVIGIIIAVVVFGASHSAFIFDRFNFSNQNLEQFSTGRIGLWKSYAQHLTLLGHDMSSVDWKSLTVGIDTRHAHNNFLDYAYRSGIVVGVCCIALQLVAGIITLISMFKKKVNRSYDVFVVIFTVQYLVLSLVDIATLPMTNYGAFFFYICITPLFMTSFID